MPRKHPRPDAHVERLAALFRTRWVPADGIAPWLRKNLPRLRRMVDDEGWSWADLGRALTLAGITYDGGRPWTGKVLTVKVAQAQNQLRKRAARRAGELPPTRPSDQPVVPTARRAESGSQPTAAMPSPPDRRSPTLSAEPTHEPEFQVARPRTPLAAVPPPLAPSRPVVSRSASEVDAEIAKLLGRPRLGSIPMPAVPEPEEEE
jgi:hypothetical protein